MKLQYRLLFVILALAAMLMLIGAGEPNMLDNTSFNRGGNDIPLSWELSGNGTFAYRNDPEGHVAQIVLQKQGYGRLEQSVTVESGKVYGISFEARVLHFSGVTGAYAEIVDIPGAKSQPVLSDEWQTVELYGTTGSKQKVIHVGFSFGEAISGDMGTAEFRNVKVFHPSGGVPLGSASVLFYDKADTDSASGEDEKAPNEGITPPLVIAIAYALLVIVLVNYGFMTPEGLDPKKKYSKAVWIYILGGMAISLIIALVTNNNKAVVNDFSIWAQQINETGITSFYSSNTTVDYPPGYMYVLYVIGQLAKVFGFTVGSLGFTFLIKLPAILCDAATAYFIYRIARNYVGGKVACMLAAIMAFNPVAIFAGAYWGQIDSILALCVVASFWAFYLDRKVISTVFLAVGVLIKPQMLMVAPVWLFAFLKDIFSDDWKSGLRTLLFSVLAILVTVAVVAIPFCINMKPTWLPDVYIYSGDPYASINAYNIYAMLGANWLHYSTIGIAGISFLTLGNIAMLIITILTAVYIFKSKDKKAIFSGGVFMIWGMFCFGHGMHESYLFPVMILCAICFALYRDKRYLYLLSVAAIGLLSNGMVAYSNQYLQGLNPVIIAVSTIHLLGFVLCTFIVWTSKTKEIVLAIEGPTEEDGDEYKKPGMPKVVHTGLPKFIRVSNRQGERMVLLDYINMLIIVVVYSLVAMVNLGSTQVPDSYWRAKNNGEAMVVEFEQQVELATAYYYPGVGKGDITFELETDGDSYTQNSYTFETKENQMYKWQTQNIVGPAKRVTITALNAGVFINEMAFFDEAGNMVDIKSVTPVPNAFEETGEFNALFDEQSLVDTKPDYMTEMYFDEIYHARTAFEHLNGIEPYENSHPPLGKIFIMLGIWLFGMNPFGWRIIGTLFGIAMLPLMYVFAKRIFKDTRFAALSTLLFALDGMHFVQTRIATIDVYGVFFIMAMCYYMYRYWQMNFFVDGLKKSFVPLGWCGVMFGIGIASKWIGFYAGAGLAVALITTFAFRYSEYRKAKRVLKDGSETDIALLQKMVKTYWRNVGLTCLFCSVFFIIIPLCIYLLSYLPYFLCAEKPYDLQGVWGVQKFMFNYHRKLTATHPFQSPWWQWPVIIRPIFYFSGKHLPNDTMSSIAAFGNPAVWWAGLLCTIICIIMMVIRDRKLDKRNTGFILICLGGALLPWVFITRATFIYHYFASVPFIILLTVMCAQRFVNKKGRMRLPVYILVAVSMILFVLFYPVWSGWPVNLDYALTYLRWLNSWWFFKEVV